MGPKAALEIINPVARVLLVTSDPVHDALAIPLVFCPGAFVVIAGGVGHLALPPLHALLPVTLVHTSVLVAQFSVTVTHPVEPVTVILHAFFLIGISALAVSQAI